jgi:gamma-glutamyltranspeptidase/glutathione hydrolase
MRVCASARASRFLRTLPRLAALAGAMLLGATDAVVESGAAPAGRANDTVAKGRHGCVVAAEPEAARIGLEVMQKGGNAVDAAIAVFLALAVTHPQAGNLGGGGFLLVRMADGRTTAFDFRERAPAAAHRELFVKADGSVDHDAAEHGIRAGAVPGSPAGMVAARERFGTRPLAELAAPAIALAREGFVVSSFLADDLAAARRGFARFPSSQAVFWREGRPLQAGERLVQKDLADTLTRFAEGGFDGFYRGPTAARFAAYAAELGGLITADDLAAYRVVEREPLRGSYRGHEFLVMPPPSSGGIALLQMLNLLEPYELAGFGHGSARSIHLLTEVMRRAYADRARWLGDPDHYPVPVTGLISKEYADTLRAGLRTDRVSEVAAGRPPGAKESDDTTHFSIVDAAGNAVACTTTINSTFGAQLVIDGLGFLLNNEMDDFSAKPEVPNQFGLVGGEANAIAPGKRPLSSMTPTIVLRDDKLRFVLGSPGGGRIINTVLQVALNRIDFDLPLREAVAAPRIHHQFLPAKLSFERGAINPDTREILTRMGHRFDAGPSGVGRCQAIEVTTDGMRLGVADPRSGGSARAY